MYISIHHGSIEVVHFLLFIKSFHSPLLIFIPSNHQSCNASVTINRVHSLLTMHLRVFRLKCIVDYLNILTLY